MFTKRKSAFARYFRRYWIISTAPGIFVEEFADDSLNSDVLAIKVAQKQGPLHCLSAASGYSTPGMSDSSAAGTPVGSGSSRPVNAHLFSPILINTDLNGIPIGPKVSIQANKSSQPGNQSSPSPNLANVAVKSNVSPTNESEGSKELSQGKQHKLVMFVFLVLYSSFLKIYIICTRDYAMPSAKWCVTF